MLHIYCIYLHKVSCELLAEFIMKLSACIYKIEIVNLCSKFQVMHFYLQAEVSTGGHWWHFIIACEYNSMYSISMRT